MRKITIIGIIKTMMTPEIFIFLLLTEMKRKKANKKNAIKWYVIGIQLTPVFPVPPCNVEK